MVESTPWIFVSLGFAVVLLSTNLLKFQIVLMALRTGLGAEQLLPPLALWFLSISLTALALQPVWPLLIPVGNSLLTADSSNLSPLLTNLSDILFEFAARRADPSEVQWVETLVTANVDPRFVRVAAFFLGEMGEALRMSLYVLFPFLVLDLIAAQLIATLGWSIAPAQLTLPLKILVFLGVGGWEFLFSVLTGSAS